MCRPCSHDVTLTRARIATGWLAPAWLTPAWLATALVIVLTASAQAQGTEPEPLTDRQTVITGLSRIERSHTKDLAWIHAARVAARRTEKVSSPTVLAWQATAGVRARIQRSVLALIEKHDRRIKGSVGNLKKDARRKLAHSGLQFVTKWIEIGEPQVIRRAVAERLPTIASDLASPHEPKHRRKLLATIADRLCQTPFRTDLEDLCELLAWTALLHDSLPPGTKQLQATTADLIVVLTDRDESGVRPSGLDYYRRGRFLDSGFGEDLRDGSDQVRHFIWALRAMARSPNFAATEQILNLKELQDSVTRKVPVEQADIALNHRAREIAELMLGVKPGVRRSERRPRVIRDLAKLVATTLRR